MEAYIKAQRVRLSESSVMIAAIEEFLARESFWNRAGEKST
jgi:hypothetical protein